MRTASQPYPVLRPFSARVRRRHGDQRDVHRCGDRLAEVDRAAPADGEDTVSVTRLGGGLVDPVRRDLGPARVWPDRMVQHLPKMQPIYTQA